MSSSDEVALFVDWENIRYSMLNLHGQEPDPIKLRDKALSYGPLVVARAYADFSEHDGFRRRLDVAGIESEHYPLKLTNGRRQSSADLHMVIDIIDTALATTALRFPLSEDPGRIPITR